MGGGALLEQIARLGGVAVSLLLAIAVAIVYAFRRNFRHDYALARVHAARDTAFLAAIAAAMAFTIAPARWSFGAAIVATEIGLMIEFVTRTL